MDNRDEWLARTFVELADTLVADFDLIEFLSMLADRCVELLGSAEVGLVLVGPRGLQMMASSTERMRVTELLEVQFEEGPCFGVLSHRTPRFEPAARVSRWSMAALCSDGPRERIPDGPRGATAAPR